jgi:hypothetical protein
VQKSLLSLTAYSELPSQAVMVDKPGVPPLPLKPSVIDTVMKRLPIGRASGTMLTSYELAQATFTARERGRDGSATSLRSQRAPSPTP